MIDSQHRYERLARDHRTLDAQIAEEQRRPMPDTIRLYDLKRQKLKLKEQLEGMTAQ